MSYGRKDCLTYRKSTIIFSNIKIHIENAFFILEKLRDSKLKPTLTNVNVCDYS